MLTGELRFPEGRFYAALVRSGFCLLTGEFCLGVEMRRSQTCELMASHLRVM